MPKKVLILHVPQKHLSEMLPGQEVPKILIDRIDNDDYDVRYLRLPYARWRDYLDHLAQAERELWARNFSEVAVCGGGVCEEARHLIRVASENSLRITNYACHDSLLRQLVSWYTGPDEISCETVSMIRRSEEKG